PRSFRFMASSRAVPSHCSRSARCSGMSATATSACSVASSPSCFPPRSARRGRAPRTTSDGWPGRLRPTRSARWRGYREWESGSRWRVRRCCFCWRPDSSLPFLIGAAKNSRDGDRKIARAYAMALNDRTVVVTGGASGIGLALAARFHQAGSTVIVCGRRENKMREALVAYPGLDMRVADVSTAHARIEFRDLITREYPSVDVLVNNAGIQRRVSLLDDEPWEKTHDEIAINVEGPIHLSRLFIPHFRRQPRAAIVNVTSGLSFAPLANVPIYC